MAYISCVLVAAIVGVQIHRGLGIAVPEWPLAVDLLLVVPLAYLAALRPGVRQAIWGVTALVSFGVLFGSVVLPPESKSLWLILEPLRWLLALGVLGVQAWLLAQTGVAVFRSDEASNLETNLHDALERRFGSGPITRLLKLEGRMWLYALCSKQDRFRFGQDKSFSVWKQGGNASNQAGFLVVMAAEIPLAHGLLHLYSPNLALGITVASLYGFVFLFAEYRATRLRCVTLSSSHLHLRYGLLVDAVLPLHAIEAVDLTSGKPARARQRLRLGGMGKVNVRLELKPGTRLEMTFGQREITEIFMGMDDPQTFVRSVRSSTNAPQAAVADAATATEHDTH